MKAAHKAMLRVGTARVSASKKREINARLATIQKKLKKEEWDSVEEVRKMRLRWSS